jgi:predicted metal-dependent hydrolase
MKKQVGSRAGIIEYFLKVSTRARRMRLAINRDGGVTVTIPRYASQSVAEKFIIDKSEWILDKVTYFKSLPQPTIGKDDKVTFAKQKENARRFAYEKVEAYNQLYNFKYNKIAIRNQKTRWGSCSKQGNLNFNYKIVLLPSHLADYIIVHELCHLGELNHSERFWNLVAKTIPNHKELRRELRTLSHSF